MPKRVSAATDARIRKLLRTKKTKYAIAKEVGVTRPVVNRVNREAGGIRPKGKPPKRLSQKEKGFIVKALRLAKFTSIKAIAERVGVDVSTVRSVNREFGIRDRNAINVGRTRIPRQQFEAIVDLLVSKPGLSFHEVARHVGGSVTTVQNINKKLDLQDSITVAARDTVLRRRTRAKRHNLFSPKQKWGIIIELRRFIEFIIKERAKTAGLRVPIEDLVQQTILESFNALDVLEPGGDPKKYVGGVTRNVVRKYLRNTSRRLAREEKVAKPEVQK